MKGHNYGLCEKCGKIHVHPRGTLGKKLQFKDIERRRVRARMLGESSRNGDGKLWIDGKNPDFWDGGKHLVELFGGTWHNDKEAEERTGHFKIRGYDCLIIWYSRLRDPKELKNEVINWSRSDNY